MTCHVCIECRKLEYVMRDFQRPGRSPVHSHEAAVATSHPIASYHALEVLRRGGNAVDAAITASAILCVVEPQMTGIGGDCFAILSQPDGNLIGVNGSGRSAARLDIEFMQSQGWERPHIDSAHAITVPGAVRTWSHLLEQYGTMDLAMCLAPAITYARDGFSVAPRVALDWYDTGNRLRGNEVASRYFLMDGKTPRPGDRFAFPHLAAALELIGDQGADVFYQGEIAQDIVDTVQKQGGTLSLDDLAQFQPQEVTPLKTNYQGVDVFELPPNGQGITALMILNLFDAMGISGLASDPTMYAHVALEAGRLGYHLRDQYLSDPQSMKIAAETLISKGYADLMSENIDPHTRSDFGDVTPNPGTDTIYLSVVDRDGRAISFINSVFHSFGSCIVTPNFGFALQNRGASFSLDPSHSNFLEPQKLPMHTLIPGMLQQDGRTIGCFGVMGGSYQAMGHAHVLSQMFDYGKDIQAALDAPRYFWEGDVTQIETQHLPSLRTSLVERGHRVEYAPSPIGGGQGIMMDYEKGCLVSGSDPRKDGCALGF